MKTDTHCQMKFILAVLFFSLLSGRVMSVDQPSLKQVYKPYFLVGCNYRPDWAEEGAMKNLLVQEFNVITPSNIMKPALIHPRENEYHFEAPDKMVELAMKNNIKVVGHTLVWHNQTPDWFFKDQNGKQASRDLALARMKEHITTVMRHYKGKVLGWDVVNEAIDINDPAKALRESSPWYRTVGPDYIEKAFEYAHEADPDAELYYNDAGIENPLGCERTVALVKNLKSKGLRIDGVGIQGHWGLYFSPEQLEKSILKFKESGVKVMITELDMGVLPGQPPGAEITYTKEWTQKMDPYREGCPKEILNKQALLYGELFKVLMRHSDVVTRVTFWGISDGDSWLNNWPIKGRMNHPLLFDRNLKPKPAYDTLIRITKRPSS